MKEQDFWNAFITSGKIDDYLKFKNCTEAKEAAEFEPYNNERINNQGTESR